VYASRLSEIRPRREDVEALSHAYLERLAPGVIDSVTRIRQAGVRVTLVSGGLRPALLRLASHLGLAQSDLHAVSIEFDAAGAYVERLVDGLRLAMVLTGSRDLEALGRTPVVLGERLRHWLIGEGGA